MCMYDLSNVAYLIYSVNDLQRAKESQKYYSQYITLLDTFTKVIIWVYGLLSGHRYLASLEY